MTTWHSLWSGLDRDTRRTAAEAFWADDTDPQAHAHAIHVLSQHGGFRPRTLQRMPAERRAQRLAATASPPAGLIRDLVRSLYLGPWLPSLTRLLDGLGLEHEDGRLVQEIEEIPAPSPERCREALAGLVAEESADRIDPLVAALALLYPELYCHLPAALVDLRTESPAPAAALDDASTPAGAAGPPEPESPAADEEAPLPEYQPGEFTTLDRQLIQAIVASVTGIEGALDEDRIEDLIDEALHLNVDRHQTYFHRGFLDLLSGRGAELDFPEANPDRRAWYLAGAVSALARRLDAAGQVALLDCHEDHFRPLLDGHHPAVVYALPSLVHALWTEGREAELPRLTRPVAFGQLPLRQLRQHLERTTDLLAAQEAERAEPLLVLLESALSWRRSGGLEVPDSLLQATARRRAHALRLRGDFAHARERLQRIEELGPRRVRARVQADLGLIEAGFRALSRIRFPDQRQDLADLAAALTKGQDRFLTALELAGVDGGHGAYCLAVQAASTGDSAAALPLAERAEAFFAANPRSYRRGGVLARAKLLLGWSLAVELESARSAKAAECLGEAVAELGAEGLYLVEDALAAFAQMDAGRAAELAQELRQSLSDQAGAGERIIDAVSQEEVLLRSPEIRRLLLDRAGAAGRSRGERYRDARRLLLAAERLDDADLAGEALDRMQGIALRNPHSEEAEDLLELLEVGDAVSTGWDGTEQLEASIELLKGRGDCPHAATQLERLAHAILGQDSPFAAQEAQELIPELEALGVEGFPSPGLSGRLTASLRTAATAANEAPPDAGAACRILFLGGNETQARYQEEIRRRLEQDFPRARLDFHFLGWSSNWGRQLDQMSSSLERADAFVLMRFLRTMCGRELRKIAGRRSIPWIACTGHGRDAIEAAIRRAVRVVGHVRQTSPT